VVFVLLCACVAPLADRNLLPVAPEPEQMVATPTRVRPAATRARPTATACANTIGGYGCGGTCARRAGAGTGAVAPLRFTAHAFGHAGFISQMRGGRLERVTLEGTLTASPGLITASAG